MDSYSYSQDVWEQIHKAAFRSAKQLRSVCMLAAQMEDRERRYFNAQEKALRIISKQMKEL